MGIDRRSFISLVAGGVVGSLCTPVVWKSIDDVSIWSQNWSWVPRLQYGKEDFFPALCKLGTDAYGLRVKTVGGKPVVAEGDPAHPLSQGTLCPLGAASVQLLYSPSRITGPKVKDGDTFRDISWEEARVLLTEKLGEAGKNLAAISGDETGSVTDILSALVTKAGSEKAFLMPGETAAAAEALSFFGGNGQPGYDLEHADNVLFLGADALESWGTVNRNAKAFARGRERGARYIYAGPNQNGTAAVVDRWIPCIPGTEGLLAFGLALCLVDKGSDRSSWPGYKAFLEFLQKSYSLPQIAAATGVAEKDISTLANELRQTKKSLVLLGAEGGVGLDAASAAAGLAVNMLLERVNTQGGVKILPWGPQVFSWDVSRKALLERDVVRYIQEVARGGQEAPQLLLVYAANPAYALPGTMQTKKALERVGFLVSFSPFMDETAVMADLLLPDCYAFEGLADAYSPYGCAQACYSVTPAGIQPVHNVKSTGDVLLAVAAEAKIPLGFSSLAAVVDAKIKTLKGNRKTILQGQSWVASEGTIQPLQFWKKPLPHLALPQISEGFVALAPAMHLKIGSAKIATPPFNTNALRYDELLGREMYVLINGATAQKFQLKQDDRIALEQGEEQCLARVRVFEGVITDAVVAPLGFGHTAWDNFSRDKGSNVYSVLPIDQTAGQARCTTVRVRLRKA